MRSLLSLLALPVILLAGCGGSYSASNSSTSPDTFSGDWAVAAHSTTFVGRTLNIGGSLSNSNGTITGTLHITNLPSCYPATMNFPVTGTLSSSNVLTVSSTVSAQPFTFTGTVTGAGTTGAVINSGTTSYSFSGGCNNGDNGTITAYLAPSYSATYSGTLTGAAASSFTGAVLSNTGVDTNGFFDASITSATFTGSSCFVSVGSTQVTGVIAGNYLNLPITFSSPASTLTLTGNATDSTGKTINGTYTLSSTGPCNGDTGNFSMTHP